MKILLQRVDYMPKELRSGVLYVAEKFGAAAHLCACGCGEKIRTPLSPTDWKLQVTEAGPTLYPSIGNWQKPCRSHYWIVRGEIQWAESWTPEQIAAGRSGEEARARAYYDSRRQSQGSLLVRAWRWLNRVFSK